MKISNKLEFKKKYFDSFDKYQTNQYKEHFNPLKKEKIVALVISVFFILLGLFLSSIFIFSFALGWLIILAIVITKNYIVYLYKMFKLKQDYKKWFDKYSKIKEFNLEASEEGLILIMDEEITKLMWNIYGFSLLAEDFIYLGSQENNETLILPKLCCDEIFFLEFIKLVKIKIPNNYIITD